MLIDLTARRLQREVEAILEAAVAAGLGADVTVSFGGAAERTYRVDRIVHDEFGVPAEAWLSATATRTWLDRFLGRTRLVLLRAGRVGGDVRRTQSQVTLRAGRWHHEHFREDVAAPRAGRSVATWRVPRADATDWLLSYSEAS